MVLNVACFRVFKFSVISNRSYTDYDIRRKKNGNRKAPLAALFSDIPYPHLCFSSATGRAWRTWRFGRPLSDGDSLKKCKRRMTRMTLPGASPRRGTAQPWLAAEASSASHLCSKVQNRPFYFRLSAHITYAASCRC